MTILIEATTVVIAISALERRFPGGAAAFADQWANATYRSDGEIAAVSFMVLDDAQLLVDALSKYGFSDPRLSRSEDIAVAAQGEGFLAPCDWLKLDLRPITTSDGVMAGATVAWMGDDEPTTIAVPDGWHPQQYTQVSAADLKQAYDLMEVRTNDDGGSVTSYRHRLTGRTLHVGRPTPPGSFGLTNRYRVMSEELGRLMNSPDSAQRTTEAARLYKRASELVAEVEPAAGAYALQGVAARLAHQWSDAESAFREITERWPDNLDAWLELTWALSSLGRTEEAETAARRAVALDGNSAAAHGNLASALLQLNRPDEAFQAIEQALRLDPSDLTNQEIAAAVRSALPWYKRWRR